MTWKPYGPRGTTERGTHGIFYINVALIGGIYVYVRSIGDVENMYNGSDVDQS
jgi:hypothetical protein